MINSTATASALPLDGIDNQAFKNFNAPEALEQLIARAESVNASDIHLQMLPDAAQIMFRLDGVLVPRERVPRESAEHLFGRIKFLARLKTYQDSIPQDGRIDKTEIGSQSDIRVATYPTV